VHPACRRAVALIHRPKSTSAPQLNFLRCNFRLAARSKYEPENDLARLQRSAGFCADPTDPSHITNVFVRADD
jgi:hypothetical protein